MTVVVKNLPANAGDIRDVSLIPGLGRSPGGRNGNTLQYSCLENPTDRGVWRPRVPGITRVRHDLTTKPHGPEINTPKRLLAERWSPQKVLPSFLVLQPRAVIL